MNDDEQAAPEPVERVPTPGKIEHAVKLTTADKLDLMIEAVRTMDPAEVPPESRTLVTGLQMAAGMGFDLLAMIRPDSDEDCALMIDGCTRLLLQLRGDDLPPFDPSNYGELAA